MNDSAWSGEGQFGASGQQEFGLFDLDNIDLDFDFAAANAAANPSPQLGQLAEELNLQHLHSNFSPSVASQDHGNVSTNAQQQPQNGQHYFDFSMPPYAENAPAFTPSQEQLYRHHAPVPPTPSSVEMHADQARYMQHMDAQQAMFEQRYQLRKDDMAFTPLVSPAVTPHEARFRMQDMSTTVPGAYFSPLTSPALKGQNAPQSQYPATSGSSAAASPIDVDQDMLTEPQEAQEEQGRKLKSNKRSAPRSAAPARIRQSPIVKAGRRKATVSSLIPPKEVSNLLEEARGNRSYSGGIDARLSRDSSETDSISPEPLSEMGPPPKPSSVTPSPAMLAQNHPSGSGVTPATPASLMRIHPSPTFGVPEALPTLDDLTLPEASLERPPLARLDTAIQVDDGQDTPRLSARKTPKLSAEGTPSSLHALNGKASPMLSGHSTPTSPAFAPYTRKDSKSSGRSIKKRGSMSSTLISPALRPKISPSIKPLLPDGGVSSDTHALLLASKSNYQNILDGTTVPGVVYPTSLSNNLTSKRTSHKMAEQGRRNRINTALQEMQALLPSPHLSGKESKSPEPGGSQSNSSKAAKVESAIEYIKQLQQQCFDKDRLLDKKDQEMEALRKEVAALKAGGSTEAKATSSSPPAETTENNT